MPATRKVRYQRGDTVYRQGEAATVLYRAETGFVRLARTTNKGRTVTVRHVLPGDYFGEDALTAPDAQRRLLDQSSAHEDAWPPGENGAAFPGDAEDTAFPSDAGDTEHASPHLPGLPASWAERHLTGLPASWAQRHVLDKTAPPGPVRLPGLPAPIHPHGAEALTNALILSFDPRDFGAGELLDLARNLAAQLRRAMTFEVHLQSGDLRQRVVRYLLELADTPLGAEDADNRLFVRATHELLAEGSGSTRESVSKIVTELRGAGLIDSGYRHITLLNLNALQGIAARSAEG